MILTGESMEDNQCLWLQSCLLNVFSVQGVVDLLLCGTWMCVMEMCVLYLAIGRQAVCKAEMGRCVGCT